MKPLLFILIVAFLLSGCGAGSGKPDPALETAAVAIEEAVHAVRLASDMDPSHANDDLRRRNDWSVVMDFSEMSKSVNGQSMSTTKYLVSLPDGTNWQAEIVRENGAVTKAIMECGVAPIPGDSRDGL